MRLFSRTQDVVLHEVPFEERHRSHHTFAVCADCAPGLADIGEDVWHDGAGMGGAPQCCMCGSRPERGAGWYSSMHHATPVYEWVWVGGSRGGYADVRPRGTVTKMADYVRSRLEHYDHPRCAYCVSCLHSVTARDRDQFCEKAGERCGLRTTVALFSAPPAETEDK